MDSENNNYISDLDISFDEKELDALTAKLKAEEEARYNAELDAIPKEVIEKTFPSDYVPLPKPFAELSKEEQLERIQQTQSRLAKLKRSARTDASAAMPTQDELNEKYEKEALEGRVYPPGVEVPVIDALVREAVIGQLKNVGQKEAEAKRQAAKELDEQIQKQRNEYKKAQQSFMDLHEFSARKANELYREKISSDTNLYGVLAFIKETAEAGKPSVRLDYLSTFDQLKIQELGFLLSKADEPGSYVVSWE